MRSYGHEESAELLEKIPFDLREGENFFGDEFCILYAELTIDKYMDFIEKFSTPSDQYVFRPIASNLNEICPYYIRFITFGALIKDDVSYVEEPSLRITNRTVEEALSDARQLVSSQSSTSGIDRAHTAFHGYLRAICEEANLSFSEDANIGRLYRIIRDQHPKFQNTGPRATDIDQINKTLSSVVSVLNPLRNKASLAHPNKELLAKSESAHWHGSPPTA